MKMSIHHANTQLRMPGMDLGKRRSMMKEIKGIADELLLLEHKIFPDKRTTNIVAQMATSESLAGYAERYALTFNIPN